ncbi:SlyX family protein [Bordetella avium]|uniref:SlyX family protein n=1 Tax=Bordetella avium TaxID=521 RepID=UPI0039FCC180
METEQELAARVTELEIKLGFAEDLLDRLNLLVFEQQKQIEAMAGQIGHLRNQQSDGSGGPWRSLFDERPPHY